METQGRRDENNNRKENNNEEREDKVNTMMITVVITAVIVAETRSRWLCKFWLSMLRLPSFMVLVVTLGAGHDIPIISISLVTVVTHRPHCTSCHTPYCSRLLIVV